MDKQSCWHCQEADIIFPYQALCARFNKPFPEGFICPHFEEENEITKKQNSIAWTTTTVDTD